MTFQLPENPRAVRALLEERFGDPASEPMTPYERVDTAIRLQPPDRLAGYRLSPGLPRLHRSRP